MKRNSRETATAVANGRPPDSHKNDGHKNDDSRNADNKNNGNSVAVAEPAAAGLSAILASLQTMRDGDFSVRLPGSWTGLEGKIADTFN